MPTIGERIKHAWNAFMSRDPTNYSLDHGYSSFYRPDHPRFSRGNQRSIVAAVLNRIAVDAASCRLEHIRIDDDGRYLDTIDSYLNECLTVEANIDQTGRALTQDAVMSLLDEGCIAIVPVDTTTDPEKGSYDIHSLRVGKIVEWFPQHVRVRLYNELTGKEEEIILSKRAVAIVENPLFAVLNEPNSTLQRLMRKLSILDAVDEQTGSGKLDLIIQLPYVVKTEARRQQAELRRKDIENQLAGSKYGIAYTDGTEKITQLNRPLENNLLSQIEYLTSMLFSQLGITKEIMEGTADEATLNNYFNRTIEPILSAITDEMKRKFLTKTARSQGQTITFFRDLFKLMPTSSVAEMADKLTRNEIVTGNEFRGLIGMKPSDDPRANELRNKNINQPREDALASRRAQTEIEEGDIIQNEQKV